MRLAVARPVRFVAAASVGLLVLTAGATPSIAATPKVAKAPAALLATTLLKASKLTVVFPGLVGRQDDGGSVQTYPETSFSSEVETQSPLTTFQITLNAYGSKGSAARGYKDQLEGAAKLAKVGDRAALVQFQQTLVLKGSQVLLVRVGNTPAGETLIEDQDKSLAVLDQVLEQPLLAATKALAHHLNGKPATKPYTHLPAGARNPCAVPAATLKAGVHKPVLLAASASESPPSQQCNYTINSQPFIVETLSNAQAVTASPPTNLDAVYAADLAQTAKYRHKTLTATIGPVRMYMVPDVDWSGEVIVESSAKGIPQGVLPAAAGPTHGLQLVRVLNGYTYTVNFADCFVLFTNETNKVLADTFAAGGPVVAAGARAEIKRQIIQFCQDLVEEEDN